MAESSWDYSRWILIDGVEDGIDDGDRRWTGGDEEIRHGMPQLSDSTRLSSCLSCLSCLSLLFFLLFLVSNMLSSTVVLSLVDRVSQQSGEVT